MLAPADIDPHERNQFQQRRHLRNPPCVLEPCYGTSDVFLVWKKPAKTCHDRSMLLQFHNVITNTAMHDPIAIPGTDRQRARLLSAYAQRLEDNRYFFLLHYDEVGLTMSASSGYRFASGIVHIGGRNFLHVYQTNYLQTTKALAICPIHVFNGMLDRIFVIGIANNLEIKRYAFYTASGRWAGENSFSTHGMDVQYFEAYEVPKPPVLEPKTDSVGLICTTQTNLKNFFTCGIPVARHGVTDYNFSLIHKNTLPEGSARAMYINRDVTIAVVLEHDISENHDFFSFYRCPLPLDRPNPALKLLRMALKLEISSPARALDQSQDNMELPAGDTRMRMTVDQEHPLQMRIVAWRIISITHALHYIVARVQHVPMKILLIRIMPFSETNIKASTPTWIDLPDELNANTSHRWLHRDAILYMFALTHSQSRDRTERLTAVFYAPGKNTIITKTLHQISIHTEQT